MQKVKDRKKQTSDFKENWSIIILSEDNLRIKYENGAITDSQYLEMRANWKQNQN